MAAGTKARLKLFDRLITNSVVSKSFSHAGEPCWEWTGYRQSRGKYGRLSVRMPGKEKPTGLLVHRVMATIILDRELCPDKETIEHACGVPWCINYNHLQLAPRVENTADMLARRYGTTPRIKFKPLIDPELFNVHPFLRELMPALWAEAGAECPF